MTEWLSHWPLAAVALLNLALFSVVAGPLSCFVLWRRMAFASDTIAHAAILGIALGLLGGSVPAARWVVLLVALAVAALISRPQGERPGGLPADTRLALTAQGCLALAAILSTRSTAPVPMEQYLFGDVLLMRPSDSLMLLMLALASLAFFVTRWRALLLLTLAPQIAAVEGANISGAHRALMLLLACTVGLTLTLLGGLLVAGMLIFPAAAAYYLARDPAAMARWAVLCALLSSTGGVAAAFHADLPVGPSILVTAAALLLICGFAHRAVHGRSVPR